MKKCSKCGNTKPHEDFNRESRSIDGLQTHCRMCQNTYKRKWRIENPIFPNDKTRVYAREYARKQRRERKEKLLAEGVIIPKKKHNRWALGTEQDVLFKDGKRRCFCCREIKEISQFHKNKNSKFGTSGYCMSCAIEKTKKYALLHPVEVKASKSKHYQDNKTAWKARNKHYLANNRVRCNDRHKEWELRNPDKVRAYRKRANAKIQGTPKRILNQRMSASVRRSLIEKTPKGHRWETIVGYSVAQLQKHIQERFLPGMDWDNRRLWDIDHIIPLSVFNFERPTDIDFKKAWALKNLRPLWRFDNRCKGAKLMQPFQPSLTISL